MKNKNEYFAIDVSAIAVAEEAIETLKGLTDNTNFSEMGFKSYKEVSIAKLGTPINVHYMWVKDFKNADLGIQDLIHKGEEILFPVEVDGVTRCSITLKRRTLHWEVAAIGQALTTQAITDICNQNIKQLKNSLSDYILIKMPEIYQNYLAYYGADDKLEFIHVFDHEPTAAIANSSIKAEDLLSTLRNYANVHKDALPSLK
ncbi:MAG: hypothetical protein ACK5QC_02950 [Bacteroidota bacterium]